MFRPLAPPASLRAWIVCFYMAEWWYIDTLCCCFRSIGNGSSPFLPWCDVKPACYTEMKNTDNHRVADLGGPCLDGDDDPSADVDADADANVDALVILGDVATFPSPDPTPAPVTDVVAVAVAADVDVPLLVLVLDLVRVLEFDPTNSSMSRLHSGQLRFSLSHSSTHCLWK